MSEPITEAELAAMERRCKMATQGPWHWEETGEKVNDACLFTAGDGEGNDPSPGHLRCQSYDEVAQEYVTLWFVEEYIAYKENDANYSDFDFIAHGRTDLPRLIAAYREQRRLLEEAYITLRHARTFITSREKMYIDGVVLYDECKDEIRAALGREEE